MTSGQQKKLKKPQPSKRTKIDDFEANVRKSDGTVSGLVRGEAWAEDGVIMKYNLAYINHLICQEDNGRVLGYDNAHGYHERHYMGTATKVDCESYIKTLRRFIAEVDELKETQP